MTHTNRKVIAETKKQHIRQNNALNKPVSLTLTLLHTIQTSSKANPKQKQLLYIQLRHQLTRLQEALQHASSHTLTLTEPERTDLMRLNSVLTYSGRSTIENDKALLSEMYTSVKVLHALTVLAIRHDVWQHLPSESRAVNPDENTLRDCLDAVNLLDHYFTLDVADHLQCAGYAERVLQNDTLAGLFQNTSLTPTNNNTPPGGLSYIDVFHYIKTMYVRTYEQEVAAIFKGSIMGTISPGRISALPVPETLSKPTEKQLDVLLPALRPDTPLSQLRVKDKWLVLLGVIYKLDYKPELLLLLISTGPAGTALDKQMEPLKKSPVFPALSGLLKIIRSQMESDDKAGDRWKLAEKRLGEIVEIVTAYEQNPEIQSLAPEEKAQRDAEVSNRLQDFSKEVSEKCSVGVDMNLWGLKREIASILTGKELSKEEVLVNRVVIWAVETRVIEVLKTILPSGYEDDVHHVNRAVIGILTKMNIPKTELAALKDPYKVAFKKRIKNATDAIHKEFTKPLALLKHLDEMLATSRGMRDMSLEWALKTLETAGLISVTHEEWTPASKELYCLVKECMAQFTWEELVTLVTTKRSTDESDSLTLVEHLHKSLTENGYTHGLLGIAAQLGKAEAFEGLYKRLPKTPEQEDVYGYTLLDYAALGGHPAIIETVWNISLKSASPKDFGNQAQGKKANGSLRQIPNLIALAAESGNAKGLQCILEKLDTYFNDFPGMVLSLLEETDNEGQTTLMRGVMSRQKEVVILLLETLGQQVTYNLPDDTSITEIFDTTTLRTTKYVNAVNGFGQTALHLATERGLPHIAYPLLENGANVNAVIASSGFSALHIAMMKGYADMVACLIEQPSIDLLVKDNDNMYPIHYATTRECITLFVDAALNTPLSEDELCKVLERAINSKKLKASKLKKICIRVILSKGLSNYINVMVPIKAMESGILADADIKEICEYAYRMKKPPIVTDIFRAAIKSNKLDAVYIKKLLDITFGNLPDASNVLLDEYDLSLIEEDLSSILIAAIQSTLLDRSDIRGVCLKMAFETLTGYNLAGVLAAAFESNVLDAADIKMMCLVVLGEALPKETPKDELTATIKTKKPAISVLQAAEAIFQALKGQRLEPPDIKELCLKTWAALTEKMVLRAGLIMVIKTTKLNAQDIIETCLETAARVLAKEDLDLVLAVTGESKKLETSDIKECCSKAFERLTGYALSQVLLLIIRANPAMEVSTKKWIGEEAQKMLKDDDLRLVLDQLGNIGNK